MANAQLSMKIPPTISVEVNGSSFQVTRGTRVKSFLRKHLPELETKCLGAIVANRLVDLEAPIGGSCELVPVTYCSKDGARIYRATLTVMLCEAVYRLFPDARVQVGQSIGDGYYFDVLKTPALSEADVQLLDQEMRAMVVRKEVIATRRVPFHEAIEAMEVVGQKAKADIIRALRDPWVALVSMGSYADILLQPLLPTTEGIRSFSVTPYESGLVLGFPPPGYPHKPPNIPEIRNVLYPVYKETRRWNRLLGVETVPDLNRKIIDGQIGEIIRVAEALHERKFASLADEIVKRKECRLVLLAGPSSSGKTTTVKRIRMQLMALGIRPKEISLDNYYVDRDKTPRDHLGEPDFECLEAIDLDLLNDHLIHLLRGEVVETPRYSFTRGKRSEKFIPMQMQEHEILLIEGIHGLNDRLSAAVEDSRKVRVYVSALTQLCIDDHNRIFTSDARLLRRIVRDRMFRGYDAAKTLQMWHKVRSGEEKHIFPFQGKADLLFNSALVYEPAVLKIFAERFLMEVPESSPSFVEACRLLEFLDLFIPLFAEDVPATSIIREFIGGSAFKY